MQTRSERLKTLIDAQDVSALRDFCADTPDLDLNHIGSTGVSALWWALHPLDKEISIPVLNCLIATGRVDPTQTWYGMPLIELWPTADVSTIRNYENQYINLHAQRPREAGLQRIANDSQNTHNSLVVQQFDEYIENLKQRYGMPYDSIPQALSDLIQQASPQDKTTLAAAIQRIQSASFERDSISNASLLHLVWQALCDTRSESYVPGTEFSETAQNERKRMLLGNLIQSQTEYSGRHVCPMGTRHLIVSTLDKIHMDCSQTLKKLTSDHVAESYDSYCAIAISQLHIEAPHLYYQFFLEDLWPLKVTDTEELGRWESDLKQNFWTSIEALQNNTPEKYRLPDQEFQTLSDLYKDISFAVSRNKHDIAALWNRFTSRIFVFNHGCFDKSAQPEKDVFATKDGLKDWITTSYSANLTGISTYLEKDTLIHAWLSTFSEQDKSAHALALWRAMIDLFLTRYDNTHSSEILKKCWASYWMDIHQNTLQELGLRDWLCALPVDLQQEFIQQSMLSPAQPWPNIAFDIAIRAQHWQHFPVTRAVTAKNQDFRGTDLSSVDLSSWTFEQCDLRLSGILANPTIKAEHLTQSHIEQDSLLIASKNNYLASTLAILEHNPPVDFLNAKDNLGNTALIWAASRGHFEIVRALLEQNTSIEVVNAEDNLGHTALIRAAMQGDFGIVSAILEKNHSVDVLNAKNTWGYTALICAAMQGDLEIVSAILAENHSTDILNEKDNDGQTALIRAAMQGNLEIVSAILEKNHSIEVLNAKNRRGKTALIWAVKNRCPAIVSAILDKNPSVDVLNEEEIFGRTALIQAAREGYYEVVNAILEKNSSIQILNAKDRWEETALIHAVKEGHTQVVRAILEKDASIEVLNEKDKHKDTALISAAKKGDHNVVRAILEKNDSVEVLNVKDKWEDTALMSAASRGHLLVVNAILEKNASIQVLNVKDTHGTTALMHAAKKGYYDVVNAILEKNTSVDVLNAKDILGHTALILAADQGHHNVVRAILEKNDSVEVLNLKDKLQDTALMSAASQGHLLVVNAILEKNASIQVLNAKDNRGTTALLYAAKKGHHEVVNAILEKNNSSEVLNAKDIWENTALICAAREGHHRIVSAILEKTTPNDLIEHGELALFLAQNRGHHSIVTILKLHIAINAMQAQAEHLGKTEICETLNRMRAFAIQYDQYPSQGDEQALRIKQDFQACYEQLTPLTHDNSCEYLRNCLLNLLIAAAKWIGLLHLMNICGYKTQIGFFKTQNQLLKEVHRDFTELSSLEYNRPI